MLSYHTGVLGSIGWLDIVIEVGLLKECLVHGPAKYFEEGGQS